MPDCSNFSELKHCAVYCLVDVMDESGDLFGKKPQTCEPVRYLPAKMPEASRQCKYLHP